VVFPRDAVCVPILFAPDFSELKTL